MCWACEVYGNLHPAAPAGGGGADGPGEENGPTGGIDKKGAVKGQPRPDGEDVR